MIGDGESESTTGRPSRRPERRFSISGYPSCVDVTNERDSTLRYSSVGRHAGPAAPDATRCDDAACRVTPARGVKMKTLGSEKHSGRVRRRGEGDDERGKFAQFVEVLEPFSDT
ncbi:hypothetical protein EVAR_79208_1 [Eumeta japonica]|uniref:Uncharacterized protein n=1 Tax=Eumeta variegata TaxID=151549 RepID=A0A4C1UTN1_EUMVA|nr:hypothetical protein EVAR_79208_1 [Eumeta japonica]